METENTLSRRTSIRSFSLSLSSPYRNMFLVAATVEKYQHFSKNIQVNNGVCQNLWNKDSKFKGNNQQYCA